MNTLYIFQLELEGRIHKLHLACDIKAFILRGHQNKTTNNLSSERQKSMNMD